MEIQWPLALFTLLTGAGGWMLACVALNEFNHKSKKSPFAPTLIGLIIVVVGGFASVLHLSHPDRIMNALSHPTSGIFIEAALVGIIAVCAIVALICFKRNALGGAKVFALLAGIFGIVISFMAGYSYIVMTSHPAWDTILLPLAYLGTAAAMGCALYWAIACPDAENGSGFAAMLTAFAGLLGAAISLAYCASTNLFGGATLGYAAGIVALDAIVAIVGFVGRGKSSAGLAWVAVICALAAGLLLRVLMWVAGGQTFTFFG